MEDTRLNDFIILKIIQAIFLSVNLKSFLILFYQNYKTIKKFVKRLNEEAKEKYFSNLEIIGGENVIVEADESKFGKRKHHRGYYVEGVWVLGMVERRIVLIPVIRRVRETLKFLLEFHIRRGSMLITDDWRGLSWNGRKLLKTSGQSR